MLSVCSCKFGVSKGAGSSSSGQQPSQPSQTSPPPPSLNYQQIANLSAKTDLDEIKQEVINLKIGRTDKEWNDILTQNGANLDILNNPEKAHALGYSVKAEEFADTNKDPNALKKYEIYKRSFSDPKEAAKSLVLKQDKINVDSLLGLYNKKIQVSKKLQSAKIRLFTYAPLLSSVIKDFGEEFNNNLKDITNDKGLLMGNEIVESIKKQNNSVGMSDKIKPFLKIKSPPVSKAEDLAKVLENNFVQGWDVAQQDIMALAINHSSEMLDAVVAYVNDKKCYNTAIESIINYAADISNDNLENFYEKIINGFLDNYDEKNSGNLIKKIWNFNETPFESTSMTKFFLTNNLLVLSLNKEQKVLEKLLKDESFEDLIISNRSDISSLIDKSSYAGDKEELKAQLIRLDTKDFDALMTQVTDGTIDTLSKATDKLKEPYNKYYFKNSVKDGKNQGTQLVEILKKLSINSNGIQDLKPIIDNKIPLVKKEPGMTGENFTKAVSNTLELLKLQEINNAIAILISTDPESLEACADWIITHKKWDDFFGAVAANMINDTNNVIDKKIWLAFNKKVIDEYINEPEYKFEALNKIGSAGKENPYLPGKDDKVLTFKEYVKEYGTEEQKKKKFTL